jgi:hypothetical protein
MAQLSIEPAAKKTFRDLAAQWLELARLIEMSAGERAALSEAGGVWFKIGSESRR